MTAFVAAFITPLDGVATGGGVDFSATTFTISADQASVWPVVQALLSFVIIAAGVYFLVVKPVQRLMDRYKTEPEPDAPVKDCLECLSKIPVAASCTLCSVQQPRADI